MNRRNNVVVHDGYVYSTSRTTITMRYFRCQFYRRTTCRATGKQRLNGQDDFVVLNNHHNHPRVDSVREAMEFRQALEEACHRDRGRLKEIYDRIALRFPVGAVTVPYNTIRSSMLRWKRSLTPNIPGNLEELALMLQTGSVNVDGCFAVVFANREFMLDFAHSQNTFIDGTFRAVPRRPNFCQILTIFASSLDHAFPLVHVFMERRTRAMYDAVFQYLQENLPLFMNGTIVTDFELPLVESLRAIHPEAHLHGCFFHYCQAIFRKAKQLGIIRRITGDDNGRRFLRKYYALALLPQQEIIPAFNTLRENVEYGNTFRELNDYFHRQWVERVTPQHFSVFQETHRTNNVMESYHRRLNNRTVVHPGIWDLLETLIDIQNTANLEFRQLEQGRRVFRSARKDAVFDARLNLAWQKILDGRFSTQDFLRQAVHFVERLDMDLHNWEAEIQNIDEEENMDLPVFEIADEEPALIVMQGEAADANEHEEHIDLPMLMIEDPAPVIVIPDDVLFINEPPPLLYFNNVDPQPEAPYLLQPYEFLEPDPIVIHNWQPAIPARPVEDDTPNILRCNVCLANIIQYAMQCGHVFCTTCAEALYNAQQPKCGLCRNDLISEPTPIFFN